jgi:hypothetical protein
MKTITKKIKHSGFDIYLKYKCPTCSLDHWLSFKESKTKGYIVVCDCDTIFKIKQIETIDIQYKNTKPPLEETTVEVKLDEPEKEVVEKVVETIPVDLLTKCCKILTGYGFTKSESESMLEKSYSGNPSDDITLLIKQTLENYNG